MRRRPGPSGFPPLSQLAMARSEKPVRREKIFRLTPNFRRTSATSPPAPVVRRTRPGFPAFLGVLGSVAFALFVFIAGSSSPSILATEPEESKHFGMQKCIEQDRLGTAGKFSLVDDLEPTPRGLEVCREDDEVYPALAGRGRDQEPLPIGIEGETADSLR